MTSPHASILAADEEIAVLEGEIARIQSQFFDAKEPGLSPDLAHRTSSSTDTLLPASLPHNIGTFVEDNQIDVENQIAHLHGQLMTTKKRRNCFTPLCRIPDELLARILAQTQLSPTHDPDDEYSTSLYNFSFHEGWWTVTLVCNHVYEIAMSSPELWAYVSIDWPMTRISTYLARSGNVSLVLNFTTSISYAREREIEPDEIVTLGGAHFARSHALSVTQDVMSNLVVQAMQEVMQGNQSKSRLAILHFDLSGKQIDFVEMLSWYPALVELSIVNAFVKVGAPANVAARTTPIPIFPLLTRLHIERTGGGDSLQSLFELLKNTPCLTELILNHYFTTRRCPSHPGVYERRVKLPSLRILVIIGMPEMVRSLLMALSWHFPLLQDLVVKDISRSTRRSKLDLFLDVLALWKHVAYSVPDTNEPVPLAGSHIWNPSIVLYRDHNIRFDTLKIEELGSDPDRGMQEPGHPLHPADPRWVEKLDALIATESRLCARRVIFDDCHHGAPDVVEWVQEQARNGWIIEEVAFVNCGGEMIHRDYIALKDSGVVKNVVWTESSMI
jgi:hypothetical protein